MEDWANVVVSLSRRLVHWSRFCFPETPQHAIHGRHNQLGSPCQECVSNGRHQMGPRWYWLFNTDCSSCSCNSVDNNRSTQTAKTAVSSRRGVVIPIDLIWELANCLFFRFSGFSGFYLFPYSCRPWFWIALLVRTPVCLCFASSVLPGFP